MQTFLPYADFEQSARALDHKRLGKQRVEVIQIVRALTWPGYGWAHHPAVLMWKGYEEVLGRHGFTCCEVWTELRRHLGRHHHNRAGQHIGSRKKISRSRALLRPE